MRGLTTTTALLLASMAGMHTTAAPVAYYSASGVGGMGNINAETWGGTNRTTSSFAFEVFIDFTSTVDDETNPIILWETGGSGTGSAFVLNNDVLHYFASNSNAFVATGNHDLAAGQLGVQLVAVYDKGAGTAGNELMTIYVNGDQVAQADLNTNGDWSGGEAGSELGQESGTQRYNGTGLFNPANVVSYPETNISFNAYWLASAGGPADNTVANILVPEPSSLALLGLGGLMIARRRRG